MKHPSLLPRLSAMMFFQYAIWGAWLPILYPFLLGHRGFTLAQCGTILAGGAAGAILGPFIAGQIADRHFATSGIAASTRISDIWPIVINPPPPTPKILLIEFAVSRPYFDRNSAV
jgi:hypothetical protein